ncbi:MAG: aminotransferase class V-fold PLP-dependent enzyme [Oscillospiraceae bacterium]|nr:aminotransferase class V-fold PLP-dependent enzyme [Oscillospiraceae bacterium]
MIYLDNAATTYPKPKAVQAAVSGALRRGANPGRSGHKMSVASAEEVYRCRESVADFFGCDCPECVAFTLNCTYAINLVLKGLLKPGDHVVCTDLEHNAVMRPLFALEQQGVSYTAVPVIEGDNDETVNGFRKALRSNTALAICTQASNVTGVRVPVERIAALCKAYGIPVAVDCAQSAGVLPITMDDTGIDYLCAPGHKGLYGPMGTGLLIAKKGENLRTILEGGTGTSSADFLHPAQMPERFEPGTQNFPGIVGLSAGIQFLRQRTTKSIFLHEMRLMQQAYDRLEQLPSVRLYTSRPTLTHHVPVLSFNVEGLDSETVGQWLNRQGVAVRAGLHCAPAAHRKLGTLESGTVRISPSAFTTQEELRRFLFLLGQFVKKLQK